MVNSFERGSYRDHPYEDWEYPVECDYCGAIGPHKVLVPNVQGKGHSLVECACGLRFFEPRLSKEAVYRMFQGSPETKEEAECCCYRGCLTPEEADTTTPEKAITFRKQFYGSLYQRYLSFRPWPLAATPPFAPAVFEVGGNVGWFSARCLELGADPYRSAGSEFSKFACDLAKERLGLNFTSGPFEEYPVQAGECYDLIIAMDVIEHTFTPHADLQKMRSLAKDGAYLILKTFCDDLDPERTMMLPPCHNYHFTQDTLRRAIEQAGWRVLTWEADGKQVLIYART